MSSPETFPWETPTSVGRVNACEMLARMKKPKATPMTMTNSTVGESDLMNARMSPPEPRAPSHAGDGDFNPCEFCEDDRRCIGKRGQQFTCGLRGDGRIFLRRPCLGARRLRARHQFQRHHRRVLGV